MTKIIYFFKLNRKKFINILIFLIVCLISFLGVYFFNSMNAKAVAIEENLYKEDNLVDVDLSKIAKKSDVDSSTNSKIKVDVKGYVKLPGVYELSSDKRVIDAINMAGGFLKDADSSVINLSKILTDQMVIVVYSKEEVANFMEIKDKEVEIKNKCISNGGKIENEACVENSNNTNSSTNNNTSTNTKNNTSNSKTSSKININTASLDELMTLSGIGESKAKSIIDYRTNNGNFSKIDDITNVSGIGTSLFEKIKNNITT